MKYTFLIITSWLIGLAYAEAQEKPLQYRNIGPTRGGRVTAVAGVAEQPNVFYMGATGGGLWKTTDYGFHWNNISDGYFATPSIGAIGVYQKNPNILYVGTGSDGIRSNVIVGKGIYKSMDAGKSWTFVGLENAGQIGSLIIHPDIPDIAYAAVIGQPFRKSEERGVFRTMNGGESWEKVLFLSDSVGAVDLEFAPDNPDIIYAAMWRGERKPWTIISGGAEDGIFKSTDGGDTWERKTSGLPTGLIGKIDFAVSTDNPKRVWAQIQADGGQEGIYKSDDYGESWIKVEIPPHVHTSIMYRPFYFTNIDANPENADNIWAGTKAFWTSYDGGETWKEIPATHADHHDLWINPNDSLLMIQGNDGGAAVSRDGGANWSSVFNQATAELYSCDVDDQFPYYLYSGQQDNTTIRVPSEEPFLDVLHSNDNHNLNKVMHWERMGGCETGPVVPKPGDPNIIYANCKGQFSVYNRTTGEEKLYYVGAESLYGNHPDDITYRFQRVTPIEVSPHDPNTVYYGSQYVHKTTDGGETWETISPDLTANEAAYRMRSGGPIDEDISGEENYAVLYALQESPVQAGIIWTGSNDGLFHVSTDSGKSWENITPDMPEGGRVSNIEASPHQAGKAYYTVYRDLLGDDHPYILITEDFGQTWKKTTTGIPDDFPVRVVRESPEREGLLFAGTEFGMFISYSDGANWKPFQRNLPIVPITDINFIRGDLAMSTLGRSFWILDDISALWQYDHNAKQAFQLFKPRDIFGGVQNIHFMLPENPEETEVKFEFSRNGEVIHAKRESLRQLPVDEMGIRKTKWDLKYYLRNGEKDFQGPSVVPGNYTVTLSYGGKSVSKDFTFKIKPELEATGITVADLKEQEELALQAAELLLSIKSKIREFETKIEKTNSKLKKEALEIRLQTLKKGPRRYDKPMIHEHVEYLYDMVTNSPQKLGEDAFERYLQLKNEYEGMR
jgi:photosystem II stability/assembly factor-like uncharacterized protein